MRLQLIGAVWEVIKEERLKSQDLREAICRWVSCVALSMLLNLSRSCCEKCIRKCVKPLHDILWHFSQFWFVFHYMSGTFNHVNAAKDSMGWKYTVYVTLSIVNEQMKWKKYHLYFKTKYPILIISVVSFSKPLNKTFSPEQLSGISTYFHQTHPRSTLYATVWTLWFLKHAPTSLNLTQHSKSINLMLSSNRSKSKMLQKPSHYRIAAQVVFCHFELMDDQVEDRRIAM